MSDIQESTLRAVTAFYDNVDAVELLMGTSIHMGYWPDGPDTDLQRAQDRLTDLVGTASGAGPGMNLLDVGCGTGAPALRLARALRTAVTGVSISSAEITTAQARADRAELQEQVSFQVGDVLSLPFAEATFDSAIAIESVVHTLDKELALREIHRVLRPGGTLVISDVTMREPEKVVGLETFDLPVFGLLALQTNSGYRDLVTAAGFELTHVEDISAQTHPFYALCKQRLAERRPELNAAAGAAQTSALEDLLGLFAVTKQIGYILLVATKPE
ncbi:SAM-dependent methyltransferase [Nocardia brasiliensis]|uniref:Type 11 methyltransferase n=1 Tax=Nocardia brasiliensis (strain ATCC 700358 / HUJEG-1) TaxID=1133849 RepID=K0EYW1_NOCB7|nr:methyltransferase domain-containing protein [Nocardia brasiliensis]AFU02677.1 type 11 methyltransferase [Nocardia brasiliensis ATCC 700358]